MKKKLHIIYAVLLLSVWKAEAQTNNDEQELKYTPNQSSIFNNLFRKSDDPAPVTTIKNLVKYCPTALFRQKVLFIYEREIVKGFTATFGIGKAFGKDFIQNLYFDTFGSSALPGILNPNDQVTNSSFSGSSPIITLGLKIYFGDTFDSGFIEFNYTHESIDYQLNPSYTNGLTTIVIGSSLSTFNVNSFSFGIGANFLSGSRDNLSHEVFARVGVGFVNYSQYTYSQAPSGGAVYTRSADDLKTHIIPTVNIGYSFGFGF